MKLVPSLLNAVPKLIFSASLVVMLLAAPTLARNPHPPDVPVPSLTCQNHEPIVWVNTRSGIYHFPGQTWYGRTNDGEYLCKHEADAHGYRATRNGQ